MEHGEPGDREGERGGPAPGQPQDGDGDQLDHVLEQGQRGDPAELLQAVQGRPPGRPEAVEDDQGDEQGDQQAELLEAVLGLDPRRQAQQHEPGHEAEHGLERQRPQVGAQEAQRLAARFELRGVALEVDLEVAGRHRGEADQGQGEREDAEPSGTQPAQDDDRVEESRDDDGEALEREVERAAPHVLEHLAHGRAPAATRAGSAATAGAAAAARRSSSPARKPRTSTMWDSPAGSGRFDRNVAREADVAGS